MSLEAGPIAHGAGISEGSEYLGSIASGNIRGARASL